jgi:hypothetical protein
VVVGREVAHEEVLHHDFTRLELRPGHP